MELLALEFLESSSSSGEDDLNFFPKRDVDNNFDEKELITL